MAMTKTYPILASLLVLAACAQPLAGKVTTAGTQTASITQRAANGPVLTITDIQFFNPLVTGLNGSVQTPGADTIGNGSGGNTGGNTGGNNGGNNGGTNPPPPPPPPPPASRLTLQEFNYMDWYIGSARASTAGFTYPAPSSGWARYSGDIRLELGTKATAIGQITFYADFGTRTVTGDSSGYVWMGSDDVPADAIGILTFQGPISQTGTPTNVTGVKGSGGYSGSLTGILDGVNEGVTVSGLFTGTFINTSGLPENPHKFLGDVGGTVSGSFTGTITGEFATNR
jgi:hypothetical protein